MIARVHGLVLAAGAGRRIGQPKALIVIDGERLVDRAVRTALEGGCDGVIVVSGAVPLTVTGAAVVPNPQWQTGMGSSLRCGLAAAAADPPVDAVCILVVDQPFIGADVVARLLSCARAGSEVVTATYGGLQRTPVVLGRSVWSAVAESAVGDRGARAYLKNAGAAVRAVECGDIGDPVDIDTAADLLREGWG